MKKYFLLLLLVQFFYPPFPQALYAQSVLPTKVKFTRQAVRRLVFDETNALPLSTLIPSKIVDLNLEFPVVKISNDMASYKLDKGLLSITTSKNSETARWFGSFNPFATYDVVFEGSNNSGEAGVEFATTDNKNRLYILADFSSGKCTQLHWKLIVDDKEKKKRTVKLKDPISGPFTLRAQILGVGFNIYAEQHGVNKVLFTDEFSKYIDLRKKKTMRVFEARLLTKLKPGDEIKVKKIMGALTPGAGQADIRPITYENGSPILDQGGRLWFTMTVRGRRLPHPLQGVFSVNPSIFDIRFEGIIVFDRGDGLLRNELASHIFYNRQAKMWQGMTVGFSAYGDPDKKVPKKIWAITSKKDPRQGFSIMKAKSLIMPNSAEDPHVIYDSQAKKWRTLVCATGKVGFPAAIYESSKWDGPYKLIAGPVKINSTGCILQKFGSKYYALFGGNAHKFHIYSYPDLKPVGDLNMSRPPWNKGVNSRCWPTVVPLPEGYPAPYIALTMDRVNYPGLKGWTYGALYFYHGHVE